MREKEDFFEKKSKTHKSCISYIGQVMIPQTYTSQQAELLAIKVLEWIATNHNLFGAFLNMTGSTKESISENIANVEFLASVLDFFLLQNDRVIQECCEALSVAPEDPLKARRALPGGEEVNWT